MTTKIPAELSSTPGIVDGSNATAITIDSSENVGIGTSSPNRKLTVFASNPVLNIKNSNADLHLEQNGENSYIGSSSTSGFLQLFTNNGNATVNMLANGNFGFGTTSPQRNVHINGTGDVHLAITNANTGTSSTDGFNITVESPTPDVVFRQRENNSIRFLTNNTERMRIDSGGAVFIAKTAHAFATAGVEFLDSNITNMTNYQNSVLNLHRTSTNGVILEFFKDNGSVGSISTNANSLPSDRNFKRDISNLDLGLDLVTKLQPSQYNYKVDDKDCPKMYGLIAQDLEESLTEVGIEKNSTWLLQHEPKDDENQSEYALDYTKLIPILINSIKELETRIKDLEG